MYMNINFIFWNIAYYFLFIVAICFDKILFTKEGNQWKYALQRLRFLGVHTEKRDYY